MPMSLKRPAVQSYRPVHAVRDVGFTVGKDGEIVALLGPNGAGKTTTLDWRASAPRPAAQPRSSVTTPGERSSARELRERTALSCRTSWSNWYLTVRETIARAAVHHRVLRGVAEVIGWAGLTGLERRKVRVAVRRAELVDLALGLIGNPALLYLYEPTTGFDPAAGRLAARTRVRRAWLG